MVETMLQGLANDKTQTSINNDPDVQDACIRITDARGLYERIKDKVPIRHPPCPMPYGELEFELRDSDGYVLVFAERIKG